MAFAAGRTGEHSQFGGGTRPGCCECFGKTASNRSVTKRNWKVVMWTDHVELVKVRWQKETRDA